MVEKIIKINPSKNTHSSGKLIYLKFSRFMNYNWKKIQNISDTKIGVGVKIEAFLYKTFKCIKMLDAGIEIRVGSTESVPIYLFQDWSLLQSWNTKLKNSCKAWVKIWCIHIPITMTINLGVSNKYSIKTA